MCAGIRRKLYALVAGMLLLLVTQYNVMSADKVSVFKITDTEGYIGLRHRYDSDSTENVPNPVSKETRSVFEEEIHVDTHGYIYHPNLLKVDLGGGVLFNQEKLQLTSGSAEYDDTLYELSARLMFLEKKPYPLIMYYDKSHPSIALNVTDVFIQENEKYGMNFSLLQPLSPVTLNFETYQQSNKGSSFKQVVNDMNYYDSVRAHSNLTNGGHAQLSYTENKKQSMSGLKSMTINPFNLTTKTTDLNSLFVFGKEREINLNVNATQIVEEEDRKLKETRFSPRVSWEHNKDFNSYYHYNFLDRQQPGIETTNSAGSAGLRYQWKKNLYSNAEIHFNDNITTGLRLNNYGANGAVTYKHKIDIGLLQFNVGLNYDEYDREAPGAVKVVDSQYTLTGISPVTLGHDYINTATIVVKRADTNVVLTAGSANDYIIIVIGNKTQIQKVNPALPANLDVLVSYEYNPGGTASYNSIGQSYQTSMEFYKHFTIYLNYRDREQNLKSGLSTLPLGSSDTTSYGFRVNYPLPTDIEMVVGGEVLNEKHNENISSYNKNTTDLFLKMDLPFSSSMYLSFTQQKIDNLSSVEDVDLVRYALRLKSHPANRLTLSLQISDEKDTGATLQRESKKITLSGQWRIRKLLLELSARKVSDTQGSLKHDRTVFNLNLRRDF